MRALSAVALLAATIVLSSCGATIWGEPKNKSWKNATGAEAFERLFWTDVQSGNLTSLEPRVAVTFAGALPSGPMDRAQFLAYLRSLGPTRHSIGDLRVLPNGNDMVVSYTLNLAGSPPRYVVSVWQQVEKDWVLIAHSQTPAGQ